jgi:aspartyl/asparaginyl beta-hydroxylase (cupin superfamily)
MRNEIWEEVAMLEQRFERSDHYNNGALLQKILELLKRIRHTFMKPKSSNDTATCKQEVIPLSPQPGQNPTVFFLQRLEAIPLHNLETCTKRHCPCIRLWKEVPRIPNSPPVKLTGDLDALKTYFSVIRKELLDVIQTNTTTLFLPFDSAVYKLANDNLDDRQQLQQQLQQAEWSSIYLYRQGIKQVETCKKYFPITTNIIETMCPHRMSGCGLGSVYFSKLKQNTKIVEHCGPSNVRLRCHLPLFVPSKTSVGSYLRVAERCICWEEGEPILFDDSFLHSAVYVGSGDTSASSTGDRIVLIADLWHPSLAVSDRTALAVLYPPGS